MKVKGTEMKLYPHNKAYLISDSGSVWSTKTNKFLKPFLGSGYLRVDLTKNGKSNFKLVHQLVLETYVRDCPEGMQCRHLDGNKFNNHISNLCWGTCSENTKDRWIHSRTNGNKLGKTKLTKEDIIIIRHKYKCGVSQYKLAPYYRVYQSTISKIVLRKTWKWVKGETE